MRNMKRALFGLVVSASMLVTTSPVFAAIGINDPSASTVDSGLSLDDLAVVLETVINWMMIFGVIIGAIFIIWGGIQYIFAGGESEKADKAKTHLFNGIIGIVIVLAAGLIVNTLIRIFTKGQGLF